MVSRKLSGFIIKRTNFGESDKILTLFTKEEGKIKVIAKGTRKMKSKFSGHTELMSKANFVISKGKTFGIVTEVDLEENFVGLNLNLKNLKNLYFIIEVIEKSLPEKYPAPELFKLYNDCFYGYKKTGKDELIKLYFISHFLRISGQFPHIKRCVKCSERPIGKYFFSNMACGVLDINCSKIFPDRKQVDRDFLKLWKYISEESIENISRINIPNKLFKETTSTANNYFFSISDLSLKSTKLDSVQNFI